MTEKTLSCSGSAMKVLLIAESANPEWTSVPLIGWSLSQAISNQVDAHLVTHVRNTAALQRAGLIEGRDFTAIDNERFAARLWYIADRLRGGEGRGWTTITAFSALAYYAFEHQFWRQFQHRIAAGEFDLVHRITPLSPTHHSLIAKKIANLGGKFILGPLNGGVPWPKNFQHLRRAERDWLSPVRNLHKLLPGYASSLHHSALILAGSEHTLSAIPDWAKDKSVYLAENGIDIERFPTPRSHRAAVPLRGIFIGRLVPYKGANLLLEAAQEFLRAGLLTLDIVGDGPDREKLEHLSSRLDTQNQVKFHGWIPHAQVHNLLRACDFLALPSVREFGGGVVLEALAVGVAPIVADYAGPSELVSDTAGIRVPFKDEETLIEGFKCAISGAIKEPKVLDDLGDRGRAQVLEHYTWDSKAKKIKELYHRILDRGTMSDTHQLDACLVARFCST